MNLFELFVKLGVDDQASGKLSNLSSKLGNGLKTAAKIGTAAVTAAAAGITALTTAAVNNYAEYEQLVGGAELLFGEAFDFVKQKSSEAYKNVQMSQSEYLKQVNGFATGLKTALGGNEKAAAELADRIITAEADIVAATGNSQEAVQNAFNGIMKSNYTMLDNLQLGITPTKEGFQEVIDKVNAYKASIGEATNYQIDNLADAQSALLDYIEMQGLSGYASMEAANTISGSVASMSAAWQNLITGLADGNADISTLVDNLVTTIVGDGTENNLGVLGNILPAVERALNGVVSLIQGVAPKIIDILPGLIESLAPTLISSAINLVNALIDVLPGMVETVLDAVLDNAPEILETFAELSLAIIGAIAKYFPKLVDKALDLADDILETLGDVDWAEVGEDIVYGLWYGIQSLATWLWNKVSGWIGGIWDGICDFFGIASPSKEMKWVGQMLVDGLAESLDKNGKDAVSAAESMSADVLDALSLGNVEIGASVHRSGAYGGVGSAVGNSFGDVIINIDGAKYSDEQGLATAVAEALQNMTDRRTAVYA